MLFVALIVVKFPVIVDSELQRALFFAQGSRNLHSNYSNHNINWRKETHFMEMIRRTKRIDDLDVGARKKRPTGEFKALFHFNNKEKVSAGTYRAKHRIQFLFYTFLSNLFYIFSFSFRISIIGVCNVVTSENA